MKIAITGATGIIGRELLTQLYNSYPKAEFILIQRQISDSINTSRIRKIELNLLDINPELVINFFNEYRPDYFFHLAWDTNHSDYLKSEKNKKWQSSSILLIDEFYRNGGVKFIGIGSSLEYNWDYPSPFHELQAPINGNSWEYGKAKLNIYKHLAGKTSNSSFLWCRIFFVFGPGQSDSRLIPLLIKNSIFGGKPISVNTNLARDYISTFEIAKQIILMFQTDYSGPVNISSGRSIKLGELIKTVEMLTSKKINLSNEKYDDNFEIKEISGCINNIKIYYPNYIYEQKDFNNDLLKVINIINEENN